MESTLKVYEKYAEWPIGRVLGFTTIYEINELLTGEAYLFREDAQNYMATKTVQIPTVTANLIKFNMEAELLSTALFSQHKIFTGLRCKKLCDRFSFQFIVLEAFIHFIRYVVIQRLMKPRRVVEIEVGVNSFLQFLHCFIAFKVNVLVLETSPKTLNSDVIQSPLFSIHADLDVVIDKNFYKNIRCKLASLVCVENCRTAVFFDCFPQKICILQRIHRIEYTPA